MRGLRFWLPALLWLPAGVVALALFRFGVLLSGPGSGIATALASLLPVAPCGLPLALAGRGVWRLGHRRLAWLLVIPPGLLTIPLATAAGLLGPLAILIVAVLASLPVWVAVLWLRWRRGRPPAAGG